MKLSILIPTTPDRDHMLNKLLQQFETQGHEIFDNRIINVDEMIFARIIYNNDFEVCVLTDNKENSIGKKRNILLEQAYGDFIAFVDSDDKISDDYIKLIFEGIESNCDACSLTGIITEDGQNPKKFIHSNRYTSWYEKDNIYYRNNNHLNAVKRQIAQQMKFPENNHGEDRDYSRQLMESGLIKTEHWIEPVIYYYEFISKK